MERPAPRSAGGQRVRASPGAGSGEPPRRDVSGHEPPVSTRAFGGGVDKAEAELREALALFEKEPRDTPWPDGGHAEIHAWMDRVMVRKDELAEAPAFYEKALAIEPDDQWVRDVLLPALEKRRAERGSR